MSARRIAFALAALVIFAVAAGPARASWRAPQPVSPASADVALLGLAAPGDRPAVLLDARVRGGGHALQLRRAARPGGPLGAPVVVARSHNAFEGAGLAAGSGDDLVASWLEIVNGSRRPVVATGPRLADRQVLAPGPRSTQILDFAADRRGDAVVTYWRYRGAGYEVFAAYRPAGARFGTPQRLAIGRPDWPVAAIGADGGAAVAWSDPAHGGLQVAQRPSGAGTFGAPATVPGSTGADLQPALAVSDGAALLAWPVRGATRADRRVVVSERARGATAWSAPRTLSSDGAGLPRDTAPAVLLDGDHAVAAWVDGEPATSARDRVVVARRGTDGAWPPVALGRPRGTRAVDVDLLGPAPGRLPQVLITTATSGFRRGLATATLRDDGSLGVLHAIPLGPGAELGRAPLAAQGTRRTWLGIDRWNRSAQRNQALLVSSAG